MVLPLKAAIVLSTKPLSFSVSVWISNLHVHVVRDRKTAIDRSGGRTPVFMQLEAARTRLYLLNERRREDLHCPYRRIRDSSETHRQPRASARICQGPGVQVVAVVPAAGPVPPPIIVVMPE